MLPADSPFAAPRTPGPHPATAELRAYAAGTLPAADEHRLEAHALDCERCAELLAGFAMSDAATTDQALATLRTRLHARVADDQLAPVLRPAARAHWPRLAAAAALLGAVGVGLWGWEQPPAAPPATDTAATSAAPAPAPATPGPAVAPRPQAAPPAVAAAPPAATVATAAPPQPAPEYAAVRPSAPARALPAPAPAGPGVAAAPVAAAPVAEQPPAEQARGSIAAAAAPAGSADQAAAEAPAPVSAAPVPPSAPTARAAESGGLTLDAAAPDRKLALAAPAAAMVRDKPMPAAMAIAPAPVAGTPALRSYLRQEADKFQPEEGQRGLQGTVRLRFTVGADGKLQDLKVIRSLRADYDEEALRIVCDGPAWRPGIANGRRSALPMELSVSF